MKLFTRMSSTTDESPYDIRTPEGHVVGSINGGSLKAIQDEVRRDGWTWANQFRNVLSVLLKGAVKMLWVTPVTMFWAIVFMSLESNDFSTMLLFDAAMFRELLYLSLSFSIAGICLTYLTFPMSSGVRNVLADEVSRRVKSYNPGIAHVTGRLYFEQSIDLHALFTAADK